MPKNYNLLLIFGGHEEAEISKISASFLVSELNKLDKINLHTAYINTEHRLFETNGQLENLQQEEIFIAQGSFTRGNGTKVEIDYVLPCIHGRPGENGDLQPFLDFNHLSYFGNEKDQSTICFNKITTKLWAKTLGVQIVPFETVHKTNYVEKLDLCLEKLGDDLFVKTTAQGSSIGCYPAKGKEGLKKSIENCFRYGDTILIEKAVKAREIEIAVFNYKDEIIVSNPGEILTASSFYSYDEKYSKESKTQTSISPQNISEDQLKSLRELSRKLFIGLQLKDLARIDFFLTEEGIFLNEINTFPGMTPISLFPQLVEASGIKFSDYLNDRITSGAKNE